MTESEDMPRRPHCPKCGMRMIEVADPAPARYESLRCEYSEAVASDQNEGRRS